MSRERAEVLTEKNVQGAPDLVVEVGSPATRRRDEKTKLSTPLMPGLELSLADIFPG